jgi:hypothetical protein
VVTRFDVAVRGVADASRYVADAWLPIDVPAGGAASAEAANRGKRNSESRTMSPTLDERNRRRAPAEIEAIMAITLRTREEARVREGRRPSPGRFTRRSRFESDISGRRARRR